MTTSKFKQLWVTCTNNGKKVRGDVLFANDKSIRIALVDTNLTLSFFRSDTTKVFVAQLNGLEFTTDGQEIS